MMIRFVVALLAGSVAVAGQPAVAEQDAVPAVTEVAPGVRQIDGKQVPATEISAAALKAAIEKDRSFSVIKKLMTVNGIASPGPAGTTTHMYKIRDPETKQDAVAILFVKGGKILDFLIT
jgi:hypothetical protein